MNVNEILKAEVVLIAEVNACADVLERVATGDIKSAIARLGRAAEDAHGRLAHYVAKARAIVADVLAHLNEGLASVARDIDTGEVVHEIPEQVRYPVEVRKEDV